MNTISTIDLSVIIAYTAGVLLIDLAALGLRDGFV